MKKYVALVLISLFIFPPLTFAYQCQRYFSYAATAYNFADDLDIVIKNETGSTCTVMNTATSPGKLRCAPKEIAANTEEPFILVHEGLFTVSGIHTHIQLVCGGQKIMLENNYHLDPNTPINAYITSPHPKLSIHHELEDGGYYLLYSKWGTITWTIQQK